MSLMCLAVLHSRLVPLQVDQRLCKVVWDVRYPLSCFRFPGYTSYNPWSSCAGICRLRPLNLGFTTIRSGASRKIDALVDRC